MKKARRHGGFSLAEVAVAAAIILAGFAALLSSFGSYIRIAAANSYSVSGSLLAEEGIEAVRLMRDDGYAAKVGSLANGADYYLSWNGSAWISTTTRSLVDGLYERKFVLAAVNRDNASGQISAAASGVTLDPDAKKVTVTVAWRTPAGATTTLSIPTYLTNLFSN